MIVCTSYKAIVVIFNNIIIDAVIVFVMILCICVKILKFESRTDLFAYDSKIGALNQMPVTFG